MKYNGCKVLDNFYLNCA